MKTKGVITVYEDLNGPYIDAMLHGMNERPEERFERFFQTRRKFEYFMGPEIVSRGKRIITIGKAEWI